jgi:tight adherence protein C
MNLIDANVPLFIAALTFVVISLLSMGILIHLRGLKYKRQMIEKIKAGNDQEGLISEEVLPLNIAGQAENGLFKLLSRIGLKAKGNKKLDNNDIKAKFLRAGLRGRNVPSIFWGIKIILVFLLPLCFLILSAIFFKSIDTKLLFTISLFLVMLGLVLPDIWLKLRTSTRKEKIVKGFPDALDLLVVCVEAGMGLDASIHRVGEELVLTHPELSDEFKILNLELRAGKARSEALRNLAERTNIEDVKSLVTLLIQTDRFGTSIAQALRVFSDSFRTARYQKAEEIAAKIGTKLIFPLVLFIFPCMFVVLVGPVAIQVYRLLLDR